MNNFLFLFFLLLFIFLFLIYNYYFNKNIIEKFLETSIQPECTWNTQGILNCINLPNIKEIPKQELIIGRLKNKYKNQLENNN